MKLAVVIPAFKARFFGRALASLARQTNRAFTVYIGDDCSQADLKSISDQFVDRLCIRYTRFGNNIGAKNLVRQWDRCMTLLTDEDWVWFFSDDDLASENCVETFYRRKAETDGDVYRFNTCTIDENDRERFPTVPSPDFESSEEMALNLLLGRRGNSMPDHVFSRDIYMRSGGFVYTPYAQAADWATSILYSKEKGMHMLQSGLVSWRKAGDSISATVFRNKADKILGHFCFIEWLLKHFTYLKTSPSASGITYDEMKNVALENLHKILVFHYRGIPPVLYLRHLRLLRQHFGLSSGRAARQVFAVVVDRLRHDRYERRLAHAH
jgi:glycosyltransferase involved in cell wall biosynthesis